MQALLHLLIGPVAAQVEGMGRGLARRLALGALLALLLLVAFGYALAALTLWLAAKLGIMSACLVVAGLMLALALVLWALARAGAKPRPVPATSAINQAALIGAATSLAPLVLRHRALSTALAFGAMGYLAYREHQAGPRRLPPPRTPT